MRIGSTFKKNTAVLVLSIFMMKILIYPGFCYGFNFNDNMSETKITSTKVAIEDKRKAAKRKIDELKKREKIEVKKLYTSQKKLEETKNDIQYCQSKLDHAKNKLSTLEYKLNEASYEQDKSARQASERIKQIYKGERIGILHLIFAAKDINTFLDRLYYQQRLAVHDKHMLEDLRAKTIRLASTKQDVENQKTSIVGTINVMNTKKSQIASSINTSQYLINKLRTDRATYESAERELARQSASITSMLGRANGNIRTNTGFIKPVMGTISSPFGWRRHPIFGSRSYHTGVDIAGRNSSPIRASNSGEVVFTGWYGGYGKVVIVNHGKYRGTKTSTLYAHLSRTSVNVGQEVKQGDVVGYEGTTGYSTGPHLHFEVRLDGKPHNPLNYI